MTRGFDPRALCVRFLLARSLGPLWRRGPVDVVKEIRPRNPASCCNAAGFGGGFLGNGDGDGEVDYTASVGRKRVVVVGIARRCGQLPYVCQYHR